MRFCTLLGIGSASINARAAHLKDGILGDRTLDDRKADGQQDDTVMDAHDKISIALNTG